MQRRRFESTASEVSSAPLEALLMAGGLVGDAFLFVLHELEREGAGVVDTTRFQFQVDGRTLQEFVWALLKTGANGPWMGPPDASATDR